MYSFAALLILLFVCPASTLLSKAAAAAMIALRNVSTPLAAQPHRPSYLRTVRSIVDFFHPFQAESGAIIDPYRHREVQYATPCYALAASSVIAVDGRNDNATLLHSAVLALEHSIEQLVSGKCVSWHYNGPSWRPGVCHFFTFPIVHAAQRLQPLVSPAHWARWRGALLSVDPWRSYGKGISFTDDHGLPSPTAMRMNWGAVALAGEWARMGLMTHDDGSGVFLELNSMKSQRWSTWFESALNTQLENFRPRTTATSNKSHRGFGPSTSDMDDAALYYDLGGPMAYDLLARFFLSTLLLPTGDSSHIGHGGKGILWDPNGVYVGVHAPRLRQLTMTGAWASLLMQSPFGEPPLGGRSERHTWNEALQCAAFEIWRPIMRDAIHAAWQRQKQQKAQQHEQDVASLPKVETGLSVFGSLESGDSLRLSGAMARGARLSLESLRRWLRPSGDLYVVKNLRDPGERHAHEWYSFHSTYNLFAAALLSVAADGARAVLSHVEGASFAETGGFAFVLPAPFEHAFANIGGMYVQLQTGARRIPLPSEDRMNDCTGLSRVHRAAWPPIHFDCASPLLGRNGGASIGIRWYGNPVNRSSQTFSLSDASVDVDKVTARAHFHLSNGTRAAPTEAVLSINYTLHAPRGSVRTVTEHYLVDARRISVQTTLSPPVPGLILVLPQFESVNGSRSGTTLAIHQGADELVTDGYVPGLQFRIGQRIEALNYVIEPTTQSMQGTSHAERSGTEPVVLAAAVEVSRPGGGLLALVRRGDSPQSSAARFCEGQAAAQHFHGRRKFCIETVIRSILYAIGASGRAVKNDGGGSNVWGQHWSVASAAHIMHAELVKTGASNLNIDAGSAAIPSVIRVSVTLVPMVSRTNDFMDPQSIVVRVGNIGQIELLAGHDPLSVVARFVSAAQRAGRHVDASLQYEVLRAICERTWCSASTLAIASENLGSVVSEGG